MPNVVTLRQLPLTLADIKSDEEQVVIYCLCCGRHRTMLVYLLRKQVGPIAFGTINGRFGCRGKGGCGKSLCVVLPAIAPTPAAWARAYRPQAGDRVADLDMPPNYFPFHIELWRQDGAVLDRNMGQVVDLEAANACFDRAVTTLPKFGEPHVTIRHQGRVLRDSRRDFKLVKD